MVLVSRPQLGQRYPSLARHAGTSNSRVHSVQRAKTTPSFSIREGTGTWTERWHFGHCPSFPAWDARTVMARPHWQEKVIWASAEKPGWLEGEAGVPTPAVGVTGADGPTVAAGVAGVEGRKNGRVPARTGAGVGADATAGGVSAAAGAAGVGAGDGDFAAGGGGGVAAFSAGEGRASAGG